MQDQIKAAVAAALRELGITRDGGTLRLADPESGQTLLELEKEKGGVRFTLFGNSHRFGAWEPQIGLTTSENGPEVQLLDTGYEGLISLAVRYDAQPDLSRIELRRRDASLEVQSTVPLAGGNVEDGVLLDSEGFIGARATGPKRSFDTAVVGEN